MSQHFTTADLATRATLSESPALTNVDRNFGLPNGLYVATVGLYLGFIGLMAAVFGNPELAIPLVIFAVVIIAGFGLAAMWAKMQPRNPTSAMPWGQFSNRGIHTASGYLTAGQATTQVLMLPILILVWGISIAVIVAFT